MSAVTGEIQSRKVYVVPTRRKPNSDPFVRKLVRSLAEDNVKVDPASLHVVGVHGTKTCYVCKEKLKNSIGVLAFRVFGRAARIVRNRILDVMQYSCLDRKACHARAEERKTNYTPKRKRMDEIKRMKDRVIL